MTSLTVKRVFVTGGTGFLGYKICRALALRGYEVIALSRSSTHPTTPRPAWSSSVTWLTGDCLSPSTYESTLATVDAVIHSVGSLFEDTRYKKAINMEGGIVNSVGIMAGMVGDGARRIMGNAHSGASGGGEVREKSNLEIMNRDTALSVAEAFEKALSSRPSITLSSDTSTRGKPPFILISASPWLPSQVVDKRYTLAKMEAENGVMGIASRANAFRPVIFRPALMYDESRPVTIPIAGLNAAVKMVESLIGVRQPMVYNPIRTDRVAEAVCAALTGSEISGIYGVEDIEKLADKVP